MTADNPNIILILADDLGFSDLGSYGGEIETPNLDELSENSIRFTQFYNSARCCPSRASLLTGLYPHQAGIGLMDADLETPGYRGTLVDESVTIAEVLKENNYQTFMSGKWHVGRKNPIERGFDEFYGLLGGFTSFWDEADYIRLPTNRTKRQYEAGKFYATDAITDYGLDFIEASREEDKPYFLYLAYNAPHFPLQAYQCDIEKYEEMYKVGWDTIREDRLKRLKSLGIVDDHLELPPRSEYWNRDRDITGVNPAWDSIDPDRQKDLAKRMAIYAAMVDRMDQNIGRVIKNLKENDEFDNTLILFCSDNGACGEWDPWGFDNWITTTNILHRKEDLTEMGGPDSYHSYGSGWANASSTPLQLYKHYGHEGGISSPLVMHWPNRIGRCGEIEHRPSHIMDLMATFIDITDTGYPVEYKNHKIIPLEGESLLPLILGEDMSERTLCFEHEGHCAIRKGDWKLTKVKERDWELYNIRTDRTELNDLSDVYPQMVDQLKIEWHEWATRTNVFPVNKNE